MMTLRLILLASALLCSAAHAQTCSGGAAGGMDATGNQCAVGDDVDSAPPAATRATVRIDRSAHAVPQQKIVGSASGLTAQRQMAAPVAALPVLVRRATLDNADEGACSGGADGGMDATGNQCAQAADSTSIDVAGGPRR